MIKKLNRNGVTLIEMLVVGIIGAILAVIFLAFIGQHNTALNEGVSKGSMMMQSDLVSSQIARRVRMAHFVFADDEAWTSNPALAARNVTSINLFSRSGVLLANYSINCSGKCVVKENNADLVTGGKSVFVQPGSVFSLSPNRKEVTVNLIYTITYQNKDDSLPNKGDMYRCRN